MCGSSPAGEADGTASSVWREAADAAQYEAGARPSCPGDREPWASSLLMIEGGHSNSEWTGGCQGPIKDQPRPLRQLGRYPRRAEAGGIR